MDGSLYGICVAGKYKTSGLCLLLPSHLQKLETNLPEPSYSLIVPVNYAFAFLPEDMKKEP